LQVRQECLDVVTIPKLSLLINLSDTRTGTGRVFCNLAPAASSGRQ